MRPAMTIFVTVVVIAMLVVSVLLVIDWQQEKVIVIDDRWWESETAVEWQEREDVEDCGYKEVCDPFDSSKCQEEWRCDVTPVIKTYTRCTSYESGRELPLTFPAPACEMQAGDYLVNDKSYVVLYRLEDATEQRRARFPESFWFRLEPGSVELVKILGGSYITGIEEE